MLDAKYIVIGDTTEAFITPAPELAVELYAEKHSLPNNSVVQVKGCGFYKITTETSYFAFRTENPG